MADSAGPVEPDPDDKDWTWVLERPCPDCGYRAGTPHDELPGLVRDNVRRWQQVLARPDVADRPAPQVWSPLEYACHITDVYRVFGHRLDLMLATEDPLFPNWDQDATARESRYREADPAATAVQLAAAGAALANGYAAVRPDQWDRVGRRSNGSRFTVETLAWYQLHDDVHHLVDVRG